MDWYIPLLIFCARVCDVSIGTVRSIIVISGLKYVAAVLGFVEVSIWVLAVGGTLKYLSYPLAVVGYAGGFAAGVLVGMMIEERLALGFRIVQVISTKAEIDLGIRLRDRGHRVTLVDGHGRSGPVEMAYMVVRRKFVPKLLADVREIAPESFVTIERVDQPQALTSTDSRFRERPWIRRILMRK